MAELVPAPFPHLLARMLREAEREQKIFDLPARRFWRGAEDLDLSVAVHGHRVANPVGPAAGPHGQMAQNVLLSWLAGGRFIELKTVQLNDRLTIPRPCIDMQTVGYNVEWSQELRLAESLREYVKGSMLIDVARAEGLLGRPDDPARDEPVLDLSVGYDLAGVRSPAVRSWIASMKDARAEVEAVRRRDPGRAASPAGPRLPDGALRPGDALDLPRLPGGRDRGDDRVPDGGDGPSRDGEAQPHAPRERRGRRAPPRRPRLPRRRDAGGGLRAGPAVGPGARDDGPARGAGARSRAGAPPEALEHAGRAQPPALLPAGRGGDVPLGPAAARDHPGPRRAGPPRAARGAAVLLRRRRQPQLRRLRRPRPRAGHRVHRPPQAGRLRAPAEVPREPRGADARAGRANDRRLRGCGRPRRGDGRGPSGGRPALSRRGAPPAPPDRPAPRPLRLHQLRQVPARLPERRQLRLRDRAAGEGVRELPRRGRTGRPGGRRAASRRASATRSPTSRTSATTAATATRSAPRTAGRTSRSPASSARSRPGGGRARATASSSRGARVGT